MASEVAENEYVTLQTLLGPEATNTSPLAASNGLQFHSPTICVICLDRIADEAISLPCKHDQFHFPCLGTWLQQSRACPLCKKEVEGIKYRDEEDGPQKVFYLAESNSRERLRKHQRHYRRPPRRHTAQPASESDPALDFRRKIYEQILYSLYVGSNRYSGYRNITSSMISSDQVLQAKAKKWIRRELRVFSFLDPSSPSFGKTDRPATNAEFLLEYILAVLKSIDIKGSAGQAEELLKDYLGRENARLFLHELENWLRSPFEKLEEWDGAVQYTQLAS